MVHKGQGVQVIYGPNVTVIKSNLEDYLETAPDTYAETEDTEAVQDTAVQTQEAEEQKVVERIVISSPITGVAADLSTAPDEAFAQKMMGDGAVVTRRIRLYVLRRMVKSHLSLIQNMPLDL